MSLISIKNTRPGTQITTMCVDAKYRSLFVADSHGFISNWNIQDYARTHVEEHPPKCNQALFVLLLSRTLINFFWRVLVNHMWRAHCESINALEFIETSKVLLSGASDCTIRVWSIDGMYIGTLGQEESWNLYDIKTYKHPHVPYDILTDYKSMPEHPIIENSLTTAEVLLANRIMESSDKDREVSLLDYSYIFDNLFFILYLYFFEEFLFIWTNESDDQRPGYSRGN